MAKTDKMKCPDCGIDMNHHADKIDYSVPIAAAQELEAEMGGLIQEVHTCPECGRTEMRLGG